MTPEEQERLELAESHRYDCRCELCQELKHAS